MNTNTNELISGDMFDKLSKEEQKEFTPVPPYLQTEARKMLGKKEKIKVSFKATGKIAEWAKYQRAKRKNNGRI